MADYYQILGIPKTASADEIKRAYRKLAHQYHPDKKGGNETKFKEINQAYQTLSDPTKRNQYDQFGEAGAQGGFSGFDFGRQGGFDFRQGANFDNFNFGSFGSFSDIFESMFGGNTSSRAEQATSQRGSDLEINLKINFKEAVFGTTKKIRIGHRVTCENCHGKGNELGTSFQNCSKCGGTGTIRRSRQTLFGHFIQETLCDKCQGEGKIPEKACSKCKGKGFTVQSSLISIKIPAGVENKTTLRLSGKGNSGEKGAPAGDLFVNIFIIPDPRFRREGNNLYTILPITFAQAALGDTIETETIHGKVKVKIPAGVQDGEKIRLRGKGIIPESGTRGDYYLEIKIVTPEKLSREEKELFEHLKTIEKEPRKKFWENLF